MYPSPPPQMTVLVLENTEHFWLDKKQKILLVHTDALTKPGLGIFNLFQVGYWYTFDLQWDGNISKSHKSYKILQNKTAELDLCVCLKSECPGIEKVPVRYYALIDLFLSDIFAISRQKCGHFL